MNGNNFFYNNKNIYITRSGYTGEDGFEISLPNNLAEDIAKNYYPGEQNQLVWAPEILCDWKLDYVFMDMT
jgi:aminomethyltransferase